MFQNLKLFVYFFLFARRRQLICKLITTIKKRQSRTDGVDLLNVVFSCCCAIESLSSTIEILVELLIKRHDLKHFRDFYFVVMNLEPIHNNCIVLQSTKAQQNTHLSHLISSHSSKSTKIIFYIVLSNFKFLFALLLADATIMKS